MSNELILPKELRECGAQTAIVLGSGLGSFVELLEQVATIDYNKIEGLPASKVAGHAGRFVIARLAGKPLLIAQGRVHLYEGWSAIEVVRAVILLHEIGIKKLLLTNAAGSVNPEFSPSTWMMFSDHMNLTGHSPLRGAAHFLDMSEIYSRRLRGLFREAAVSKGMALNEGVYAALVGPQYETPAEIRMLQRLGADAVGMSTVLEAIQAHALGMEIAAFSCLTNWGAGLSREMLNHKEVITVGKNAADGLAELLKVVLPSI